ncbi:dTDP-4-dehydrorhamnose 3,5-epimerase [bacterium BMS3Bbin12]|nr:dTDP-4-dehydrorhamnose 3,5-epimerase [bacterium BMS3Abin12]GBE47593.1 dTDP-4-dehydrorhamnose 3,5-epimerase [bacterium BMS3Bbin12]GBE50232.1 dTDP-4-dehydrorhamnose 3,5-epimerase [bacterium BMS3Bbin13]HDJ86117.1 dTDP-4-dehydrorhamnose 3,5-epimerase [Chromatiales bacterium]HDK03528.1 dTDP-4-dehydrorhamnose 3,5-epimerase [Gammaproteobacteria bacterium]
MKVIETELPGVLVLEPPVFGDSRGFFQEVWNRRRYAAAGIDVDFVQDNVSRSTRGVLRGLHFQHPGAQGKLVWVLEGEVYDVALDVRAGSPSFGRWTALTLSAANHRQFYLPPGFAHGFCVVSESALFAYKCTDFYAPGAEGAVRWDDPDLAIPWPIENPAVSTKDAAASRLCDWPVQRLPSYREPTRPESPEGA